MRTTRSIAGLLCLTALLLTALGALAAGGTVTVRYDHVLVLAEPAWDAEILQTVDAGTELSVTGEEGEWYAVSLSGRTGYMPTRAGALVQGASSGGGSLWGGLGTTSPTARPAAQATAQPTARPTARPTAAPTAAPSLSVSSLKINSVTTVSASARWNVSGNAQIDWKLYQAGSLWDSGTLSAGSDRLSLSDLVPNASYTLYLYKKGSNASVAQASFATPEAQRYSRASLNMIRFCSATQGANYFDGYTLLRNVSVSQIEDPSKFLYVLYAGDKGGGQLGISSRNLVIYRDGEIVVNYTFGADTIPSDWYSFKSYYGVDAEYVSEPGNYTATIYWDDLRLGTTTFSVY